METLTHPPQPPQKQEAYQSAKQLAEAYNFAFDTGADVEGPTTDGLRARVNAVDNPIGFVVDTMNTPKHRSRVDIKPSIRDKDGATRRYAVTASEGFAAGHNPNVVTAKVDYTSDPEYRYVRVNRQAVDRETGKVETGAVHELTGKRAERATEILEARAARMLGREALKRVQSKVDNYTPPQ